MRRNLEDGLFKYCRSLQYLKQSSSKSSEEDVILQPEERNPRMACDLEALYSMALQPAVARSADILVKPVNIETAQLSRELYKGSHEGGLPF